MSNVLVFDVRAPLAHFRRPDTLGTHASYPFITRTAVRGLAASVLGRTSLPPEVRAGLRLLKPVRTVAQELSMHGKTWEAGSGRPDSFHRPTAIEIVVEPHYRIYYAGPFVEELSERIRSRHSHFHTYLGSAFCLTFPEWISEQEAPFIVPAPESAMDCHSVLPTDAVGQLVLEDGRQYARAGGMLWSHEGEMQERRFRGRAVAVIYEVNGRVLRFKPAPKTPESFWAFHDIPGEGTVCLW